MRGEWINNISSNFKELARNIDYKTGYSKAFYPEFLTITLKRYFQITHEK